MRPRTSFLVIQLVLSSACAPWVRLPPAAESDPPPQKLLQVWSQDTQVLVRDLRLDGDTLRGLIRKAHYCDNCMFAIARDRVDSIRVEPVRGMDSGLVLGGVVVLVWALLIPCCKD